MEASAGQPATGVLLEDGGFMLREDLQNTGRNGTIKGEKSALKVAATLV